MQEIIQLIEANINYIIIGLVGTSFLFFVLIIILLVKYKSLQKKYNRFMRGSRTDIEGLLKESISKAEDIQKSHKYIRDSVTGIEMDLKKCIQKVGLVRYSAVEGVGPELSFALALLDQEDTGLVINGIYTREGSYSYAKRVVSSKSSHTLSDEEIRAINLAKEI